MQKDNLVQNRIYQNTR